MIADLPPVFNDVSEPQLIARLKRAMLALSRTAREVFLANQLDNLTFGKIAMVTGLSVDQGGRHVAKALEQALQFVDGDERPAWQRWWQSHLPRWFR